jgi:hypothetical protein
MGENNGTLVVKRFASFNAIEIIEQRPLMLSALPLVRDIDFGAARGAAAHVGLYVNWRPAARIAVAIQSAERKRRLVS